MKWLKKLLTNGWFYIILIVLSLFVPFVINELYKKGDGYITLWEAKDVFAFYGSYLSFLGSLVLGAVAVFQNQRANELTKQMQKLEQAKFVSMVKLEIQDHSTKILPIENIKNIKTPNHFVDECINLAADNPQITQCYVLDTVIENNSEYPIVQICIHPGMRGNANGVFMGMESNKIAVYIPANEKLKLRIAIPSNLLSSANITSLLLSIDYTNIFDYTTAASLYLNNLGVSDKFLSCRYRLSKFVDIKPK